MKQDNLNYHDRKFAEVIARMGAGEEFVVLTDIVRPTEGNRGTVIIRRFYDNNGKQVHAYANRNSTIISQRSCFLRRKVSL